jgi:hypothetical protein
VKGLQRNLLFGLMLGLAFAAFILPSAFAEELKGEDVFVRESLKGFTPLIVGLGIGLAVWIGVSARRAR